MKYIRTKDGKLYEVQSASNGERYLVRTDELIPVRTNTHEIIKQADTIEELCDEFVWKWIDEEFPYSTVRQYVRYAGLGDLKSAMRVEERYGKYLNFDYKIYGAIWTDKGLIYVAKAFIHIEKLQTTLEVRFETL